MCQAMRDTQNERTFVVKTQEENGAEMSSGIELLIAEGIPLQLKLDKYRSYFEEIRTDNSADIKVRQLFELQIVLN